MDWNVIIGVSLGFALIPVSMVLLAVAVWAIGKVQTYWRNRKSNCTDGAAILLTRLEGQARKPDSKDA